MITLLYLLSCYPVRRNIFYCLRPWDLALLSFALDIELSHNERVQYLNPIDDIFEDRKVLHVVRQRGLKITLVGNALSILQDRLRFTKNYLTYFHHKESHGPVYVIFSGDAESRNFLHSKFIFEANSPITENDILLSKWMRVEPLCSDHYASCAPRWLSGIGFYDDPKTIYQDAYWWDPYNTRSQTSCHLLSYHTNQPAKVITYITFGSYVNIKSINIPMQLSGEVATVKNTSFTINVGSISKNYELMIRTVTGSCDDVPAPNIDYAKLYNDDIILSIPLNIVKRGVVRYDIALEGKNGLTPGTVISATTWF
jgi:hypothetical protein